MRVTFTLLALLCLTPSLYAQNQANIWYFGRNAGLDFSSGNPVVLTNGNMDANEGCASISDENGMLLFYTDGMNVYNKNHNLMQNGTGLNGHPSSTHSAIIVPKPESTSLYYIFTIDALTLEGAGSNGLQYSEVDMTLNGGLGAVTNKNRLLHSSMNEKITAVKKNNSDEYWVVAHKYDSYDFVTYNVTNNGINTTPIISSVGSIQSTRTTGQIKISPDGSKLAVAWTGKGVEVFRFNINDGKVEALITVLDPPGNPYGIEFSPNSNILYSSYYSGVSQYNLNAGSPTDIFNSGVILQSSREPYSSLQLGPDGKIYVAKAKRLYVDVIKNPNIIGVGCNYQYESIYLSGRRSGLGLPTFVSSYFNINGISYKNICFGDLTHFYLSESVDSIAWDFGDPASGTENTSTDLAPIHVFSAPGTYQVQVTATLGGSTISESINVTIEEFPVLPTQVELKQCDDDLDGYSTFNLEEVIPKIISDTSHKTITFFGSQTDAEASTDPITETTVYRNRTANNDTLWVRVENNIGCYGITAVELTVTTTQIPDTFTRDFHVCDDNADGVAQFDLTGAEAEIAALFPMGQQPIISYYNNEEDALAEQNPITDLSNYRNTGYPGQHQLYVRVDSGVNNDCLGLGAHINLSVVSRPVAHPVSVPRQCDDDLDGEALFDVTQLEAGLIGAQSNVSVSYFDENDNPLPSPLPNPFASSTQLIRARVTNTALVDGSCYDETSIRFTVDQPPLANPIDILMACDDGLDDRDGLHDFDTSQIETTLLQGQTGMAVRYILESGEVLPDSLPNPFPSGSQTIIAEVYNPLNPNCSASTPIDFVVNPLPEFSVDTPQMVCSSNPSFTVLLDPMEKNPSESYHYQWVSEEGVVLSNAATLSVSDPGTYSITLTKTDGTGCSRTMEIFVNASEMPTITQDNITVVDNSSNNTIRVDTTSLGQGDYEFSLDNAFAYYQDEPLFENVPPGIHTLYVRDKKGCGTVSLDISVIGYPKFFTPNGDGFNDYWQIDGVNGVFQTNSQIHIYDRYGKLVTQLASESQGWDGTYRGSPLPSDDYWFRVRLDDGRVFKGHFALKR